jgi:hypothetical protein
MALPITRGALRRLAAPLLQKHLGASAVAARPLHTSVTKRAAKVSPAELTKILSERIANFQDQQDVQEVGRVLSVGDGIARIYGLNV